MKSGLDATAPFVIAHISPVIIWVDGVQVSWSQYGVFRLQRFEVFEPPHATFSFKSCMS